MTHNSRFTPEDHAGKPEHGSAGQGGTSPPGDAETQLAWARALEVCRRRFVERRGAAQIQDGLAIPADYYEQCMRWLLRSVMPQVKAGDCVRRFDRRVIALADADLVGIAVVQSVNDHVRECAECAAYLRDLRKAAHVFITSDEPAAGAAPAPYVVPSLHSSQLTGLRGTSASPKGPGPAAAPGPSTGSRPPSKPKRSRHSNGPLLGLGAVAAAAAVGATLVPSQPPTTADVQHATNNGDRSRTPAGRDHEPGADRSARSLDENGPPAAAQLPRAPQRLVVADAGEQPTPAPAFERLSDLPEVELPVAVSAPAVDLATHEASVAAAKARVLAVQFAAASAPTIAAPEEPAPAVAVPATSTPAPADPAPAAATQATSTLPHADPAPAAPVPAISTLAPADPAPAAPADAAIQGGPADEHGERASPDTGSGSTEAPDDPAPTVASAIDMTAIAPKLDEVRESLRTLLAEHAQQLQSLLSGATAPAGGDAPAPEQAVSVPAGGAPAGEPAATPEPSPADEHDMAPADVHLDAAQVVAQPS